MNKPRSRTAALVLAVTLVATQPAAGTVAQAQTERWRGVVDLSAAGGSGELELFVTFTLGAGGATATISIPAQGATDVPLAGVVYTAERLEFTLVIQPQSAEFRADRQGDAATGTLNQGVELPLRMERITGDAAAGPSRPQHPRPPFPYEALEVGYVNPADGTKLAGTLTVPPGAGPHPAVLLITGSGAQDRDETIFGHKPFWVIADHLTRHGVAVLRVDDRGVGGTQGPVEGVTSEDFAGDVLAGIRFLAARPDIDAARIGLIGHSEGGIIAPMAAATAPDEVAFVVLLAGPGLPGKDLMPLQLAALQRAAGRAEDNIARQIEAQRELIAGVLEGADEAAVRAAVTRLVDVQLEAESAAPGEARRQLIERTTAQVTSPWYRFFLAEDPRGWLARVKCPVLALNGTLDLQVPAEADLQAIAATLEQAGNPDVTTRALPGLNHLFQTAATGHVAEYGQIEETFAPAALELMSGWIRARTGLDG